MHKGGRRRTGRPSAGIDGSSVQAEAQANPGFIRLRRDDESRKGRKAADSMLPGKASYAFAPATVPQTDTGRRAEHAKALERTLVKELGKIAP